MIFRIPESYPLRVLLARRFFLAISAENTSIEGGKKKMSGNPHKITLFVQSSLVPVFVAQNRVSKLGKLSQYNF